VVGTSLPDDERRQQRGADHERADDLDGSPATSGAFDDPEEQRDEADCREQGAEHVEAWRVLVARLGDEQHDRDDRDDADWHVDEEDRSPPVVLEQVAANQRADRDAQAGHSCPQCDRPRPLVVTVEDVRDDRERRRHDERRAETLHAAQEDER
jgi:hypothetical protein